MIDISNRLRTKQMTTQVNISELLEDLEYSREGDQRFFFSDLDSDYLEIPHKFVTESLESKTALADQESLADPNFFGPWYTVEAPITAIIEFENGQLWATKDVSPKNSNAVYVRIYPWQNF